VNTYRIAILTEHWPVSDDAPSLYSRRYYNPDNECENFPFGTVGAGRFLATLADVPTFSAGIALAIADDLARIHGHGRIVLEPTGNPPDHGCPTTISGQHNRDGSGLCHICGHQGAPKPIGSHPQW